MCTLFCFGESYERKNACINYIYRYNSCRHNFNYWYLYHNFNFNNNRDNKKNMTNKEFKEYSGAAIELDFNGIELG